LPFLVRLVKLRRLLSRGRDDGLRRYAGYALLKRTQDAQK
jgi:hypothetical protein